MEKHVKTIKDIARILNISPSTVSRVLNKKGYYSPEVETKVMDLVNQSGFVYNMSAKTLRNSKSYTIGFMIPDISNAFFSSLALFIEEYCNKKGYSLYICNTHTNPDEEYKHFNNFAANRVDGILCIAQMTKIPMDYQKYNIPIVTMDRVPLCEMPVTKVLSDDYQLSYNIAELLVRKKCKKILLLSVKTPHNENHENSLLRVQGFKDGLKHHGISLTEDHIIGVELSLDDSIFDAEGHINSLLARGVEFDGIFAITDRFALGALYALKKHGIQVPEQVKVIGFDNSIYSMISQPSISTVDRNIEGMALAACNKLFQLIESDNKIDNSTIIIPSKIIERESS